MHHRTVPGAALGASGTVLGIAGAHWALPVLSLASAACSLGATATFMVLWRTLKEEHLRAELVKGSETPASAGYWSVEEALASKLAVARRHLWPVTLVQLAVATSLAPTKAEVHSGGGDGAPDEETEEMAGVLSDMGGYLRLALRESDLAARVAHNRFIVVLDDTSEDGGVWTIDRLQDSVEHYATGSVKLMAGVASYPTHALNGPDLLRLSESALHVALSEKPNRQGSTVRIAPIEPAEPA